MPSDPTPSFRRPVQWGRAPQTVFRAGPLPTAGAVSPPPTPRPLAPRRAGILTGSLIPTAPATPPARPGAASTPDPVGAPDTVQPALRPPLDLTVRPLPEAPAPAAAPGPVPTEAPTPDTAAGSVQALPAPRPRVHPARQRRVPSSLWLAAGVAGLALAAGAGWLALRPATTEAPAVASLPQNDLPIVLQTTPAAETVSAAPLQPETAAPPVATRDATPAPATRPAPATVATPPRPDAQTATSPPRVELAPAPVITTETPPVIVAPAPTQAEAPATDPDAPIATRPQPLD